MILEPGSFRDRDGRIAYHNQRVFRLLSESALADWHHLADLPFVQKAMRAGKLIPTHEVDLAETGLADPARIEWAGAVEHQRIPFISYPYEWSFQMLRDAALLTLDLLDRALQADFSLKDGTAYNVQFQGARPVFIDTGSLEPLPQGAAWVGYRQFCQLFLFPLLLQAHKKLDFQPLLRGNLEGITPAAASRMFSFRERFKPGVMTHVYLQAKLTQRYGGKQRDMRGDLKSAGFGKQMVRNNVAGLKKLISKLQWQAAASEWGDYTQQHNYDQTDQQAKAGFVDRIAATLNPGLCWDLGANTGEFSRIAANHADYVVAADIDHLAVDRHYRLLREQKIDNVLPLVFNIADPSPNWGWQLTERSALPARGKPDLILALALIHHIVITANIPVAQFVAWLAELGGELIIEFVTRDDEMVKRLLLNKKDQYDDYGLERFEACLAEHYQIDEKLALGSGNRYLFHCMHTGSTNAHEPAE